MFYFGSNRERYKRKYRKYVFDTKKFDDSQLFFEVYITIVLYGVC